MRAVSNHLAPILVRSIAAARVRLGVAGAAGGVVVHGASGSGKTALALAAARKFRCVGEGRGFRLPGIWTDTTVVDVRCVRDEDREEYP